MQHDHIELIQRLCVIAGSVIEDASVEAISILHSDPVVRAGRLARLQRAGADIAVLLDAAAVLGRRLSEND